MKYSTQSDKIGETKEKEISSVYKCSDKEKQVVSETFSQFRISADDRNRNFENFDGLNLIQYIEDSYRRYNTNVDVRENIEDWQSSVHDPFTRNKVNAILGKVVSVLPIAEVKARGDEDTSKGLILSNLYQFSEDIDDYEEFLITLLTEAIVKGTGIGYEGYKAEKQKLRYVSGSGDDIKITEKIKKESKLFSQVVKLEDFYPSSVGVRKIKEMPRCFWRNVQSFQTFKDEFSNYEKSAYVKPFRSVYSENEQRPYYFDYVSSDVSDGSVEIIRKYDKENDQFIIIANGIWLNPINTYDGLEEVSPLPFNHKELPFFDIKFELFGSDFFYGKSLPDKLKNMQDVLNVLTNMLLDQSFLTIFPPILTNGFDSIEDDYLRPGRRTPVDTQGLPINQAYMKLDLGTPSGWHQYILEYTRKIMEESSVDKVSQGIAGTGDRTTAQEIRVAAEGVSAMLGLFGRWVKYGVKRKAFLRTKNIAQFWMDGDSPMVEMIGGEGASEEAKKAFNVFKIDSAVLSNGKRGVKIIELYKDKADMPTSSEQKIKGMVYELANNKKIEYVSLIPEYVNQLEFDIQLVPSVHNELNKDIEKALALEKVRVYKSFFPNLVDDEELLADLAEKMGDDPVKIIKKDVLKPQQDNNMNDGGINTNPQGNVAENAVRGAMGGDNNGNAITALQNNING